MNQFAFTSSSCTVIIDVSSYRFFRTVGRLRRVTEMTSSQVNLRALNTLTAYIAVHRDLPVDPSELVDFAHSQYDVEEITYNEARSIIRTYTKNLDDYRNGKVVYSSVDRTRGVPLPIDPNDKSKRNHHLRVPTFDMMASTDFAIINEILGGPTESNDEREERDNDGRPALTKLQHSVSTESSTSSATTQSERKMNLATYREPASGMSRSFSSPDLTSTESKRKKKRKKHKKKKKSKRKRRKERAAALKEGQVVEESTTKPVGLWDTVCSLFAPPDIVCYCSGSKPAKEMEE